jgi:hypothetical protein
VVDSETMDRNQVHLGRSADSSRSWTFQERVLHSPRIIPVLQQTERSSTVADSD